MSKFLIELIFILLIVAAIAVCIWNSIPTILKFVAILFLIVTFLKVFKSK